MKPPAKVVRRGATTATVQVWADSPDEARTAAVEAILDPTDTAWTVAIPVRVSQRYEDGHYSVTLQALGERARAVREGFERLEARREEHIVDIAAALITLGVDEGEARRLAEGLVESGVL